MPNFFANFMLFIWPLAALFLARNRPAEKLVPILFITPYLILPVKVGFDLPGIPTLDKYTLPALTAFLIFYFKYKDFKLLPNDGLYKFLIILLIAFPLLTWITNTSPIRYGFKVLSSLTFRDVPNMLFTAFTTYYAPFITAYNYLNNKNAHRYLLVFILIAGLFYSLPTLWEIRMSPQLHKDIYGFFPHNWRQQVRQEGFRPVVFLGHGLYIAVFFSQVLMASLILSKRKIWPTNKAGFLITNFLIFILVLSKSWSALIYGILALLIIKFFKPRSWLTAALVISLFVGSYPMLRSLDLVPTQSITSFLSQFSIERAGSLQFRFDNEDILLDKANERSLFGWGGWGRSRVYDPDTGQDLSVTDGTWILIYGTYGLTGFLATFGLMIFPIISLFKLRKAFPDKDIDITTIGISLILCFNLLDLLPNSSLSLITPILAGALAGYCTKEKKENSSI